MSRSSLGAICVERRAQQKQPWTNTWLKDTWTLSVKENRTSRNLLNAKYVESLVQLGKLLSNTNIRDTQVKSSPVHNKTLDLFWHQQNNNLGRG